MYNKKAGRPKGSMNKPKFISISVKEIMRVFSPESIINIDAKYSNLFVLNSEKIILNMPTNGLLDSKVEVKRVTF